ncbi:MAG: DUF3386 domain-containing protein [Thermosynechococcaceae cyanobacterium]
MTATTLTAQDLFRACYENRYTWDQNFPGYTADVLYKAGEQEIAGQVRIGADLKLEVNGVDDEDAKKAIHGQLFEMSIHRVRRSFEETHGKNSFTVGETKANGAVEILMGGKAEGDKYEIKDQEVTMVHRHIHGVVVTIHTYSSHNTGEGYLSHEYDSVYHDPKSGAQKGGKSNFVDEYQQVGSYFVLSRRAIETESEGQTTSQEFCFTNIKLLDATAH